MRGRQNYGQQAAAERILSFLRSHGLREGDPLPPLAELASVIGVSRGTIWKAAQKLRTQGVITGNAGHVFQLGPAQPAGHDTESGEPVISQLPASLHETSWSRAKARLEKEILNGAYPPGTVLPPNKELQRHLGICYRTLHKTLHSLTQDSILEPNRTGYAVPALAVGGWRPRIVCMARSLDETAMVLPPHDEVFLRALELHCRSGSIELDTFLLIHMPETDGIRLIEVRTGRSLHLHELAQRDLTQVLGFVVLAPWEAARMMHLVAGAIRPLKKPVAVLDGTGTVPDARSLGIDPRRYRVYSPTVSAEAGASVGRQLLAMGHRNVAFISSMHGHLWSRRRLDGITSTFTAAGLSNGVRAFALSGITDTSQEPLPYDTTGLHLAYAAWQSSIPPQYRIDVDRHMSLLDNAVRTSHAHRQLHELFAEAARDRSIEAWVTVNDFAGVSALDFLARTGRHVPDDIAVVSFDNFADAVRSNLSSYDFNLAAVAQAALGFVIGRRPFSTGKTRIEGFVVSRLSTGGVSRRQVGAGGVIPPAPATRRSPA